MLETKEGEYMQPMLIDQFKYLYNMITEADQEIGKGLMFDKMVEDVETLDVNIYNILGVSVYNTTIDSMGRLNDLDVSMLASGIYTVQVRMITKGNEEILSVHKLIKK